MTEELVPFGSVIYWQMAALLLFARGMDLWSTRVATPRLILEANPIARKLGWKWGMVMNLAICGGLALSPVSAIVVATTSVLVAARNFQYAWVMRSLGEAHYNEMVRMQLRQTPWSLYVGCLAAQCALIALVGGALMWFSGNSLITLGIGFGVICYALAVAFYTMLSVWPLRRSMG